MYHFIDDSVKITFKVPKVLQDSIDIAEQADKDNNLGKYLAYADNIDILAKNCCADGAITRMQWDMLCNRYVQ